MRNFQQKSNNTQRPSAFTLLEVLLAITVTGFVLAAASTMLVSVSNIWASRLESNFFDDHVDGVAEFIQSSFTQAGLEIALASATEPEASTERDATMETPENSDNIPEISVGNNTGDGAGRGRTGGDNESATSGLIRLSEDPIDWAQPPGFANFRDPLINFKLRDQPPLFVNLQNAPVFGTDVFLHFDRDEGLSLLWYSILQEEVENENDLRRTAISPYVTGVRYIYWDERFERWEEEDKPLEAEADEYRLPRYIKLIFEKDGLSKERTISIPVPSRSAILF